MFSDANSKDSLLMPVSLMWWHSDYKSAISKFSFAMQQNCFRLKSATIKHGPPLQVFRVYERISTDRKK